MRVNLDYMAELLVVFLEADSAHVDLNNFKKSDVAIESGSGFSENFIFHIQIALDNQLIGTRKGVANTLKDIGISFSTNGTAISWIVPLRLTQTGHDFAATLANKEVLERLKTEFKDAPFKSLFDGGQKLLQHILKKKLDTIIGEQK
ncbi:DUF2513 domain-containing protein [Microbulbifer sp. TRSA002]|uniref:DUF2513 domain-containing protein n=1 Tax=Microbulbifer sp. TRSA002 TaxID=3243382 RepID=UPI004039626C